MKDRIAHIMRAKNLKASDFAELLGIQPSGISHILSGRNQPSLDFVKKLKETFPEYNLDWIVFGKGPMTTSEPFNENRSFTPLSNIPVTESDPMDSNIQSIPPKFTDAIPLSDHHINVDIKNVLVLYDDGTFERFVPR